MTRPLALALATLPILLAGCAGSNFTSTPADAHAAFQGSIHGGQQPISGAQVGLYIASTGAYAAPLQSILKTPVYSNQNGQFNITGDYSCKAGDQLFLTGMGGDSGAGNNVNSGLMAALGDCANLTPTTFINVNEITTVGSVFALAPFMGGTTSMGTAGSNVAGLVRAFASVHKLVNVASGRSIGDQLPAGAIGPTNTINTLADLIATCINSAGATGGSSPCDTLFALVTPAGGTAPADTIAATLAIARNPTLNAATLFNNVPPASPFEPTLTTAPADWTLSIQYTAAGFNQPSSTSVDQSGNIWVANAGNNTVTLLTQGGVPSILSGNGLTTPTAVAIDSAGNAWIANSAASSISAFSPTGAALPISPLTNGGISLPISLAFDATGNLWVANSGNSSISKLSANGNLIQQVSSAAAPTATAINPK